MPVLIDECADYPIENENNLKLFPQRKHFSKTSDSLTDDILDDSIFFVQEDLILKDITNAGPETKLSNNLKSEKAAAATDPATVDSESKASDLAKIIEVLVTDERCESVDVLKIENERNTKKLRQPVDEKESKFQVDANKMVNKVAPLQSEKSEAKKLPVDKKSKDAVGKLPLSDNRIRLEDMKKKSFAQNNGRKYGLTNEEVKTVKNKGTEKEANSQNCANRNAKDAKDPKKKVEQTSSSPLDVKSEPKPVPNRVEENATVKKAIDKKTGKIVVIRKSANENDSGKKALKYTDTGLGKLRKWQRKGVVEAVVDEPEPEPEPEPQPVVEEADAKKNKKGTDVKPFSFEVREIEFLKKKQMLAKMGEQRKFEIKKWARSPEILRKKPFSIRTNKRYIIPDRYKLKLKTEERIKKRPKFDAIVEQKQKTLKEQQMMKDMVEVRELRKARIPSPNPIPENIMRLLEEAKKLKSDVSSEVSDSEEDLFRDVKLTDVTVRNPDAGSLIMLNGNENRINSPNELKHEADTNGESAAESKLEFQHENTSNDASSDEERAMLSSEENEPTAKGIANESDDASSSTESTTKYTPYNLLMSAFKKKYSS